jgi:hypothetical protein
MTTLEPTKISLDDRYKKSDSIVFRRIADEAVLVPMRTRVADLDSIFALNETAAFAWGLLDGEKTLQAVLDQIVAEYAVEAKEASQDLVELIGQLIEIGTVEKV